MSVLKSQRKESSIKFLDTAYNLELHTLKCCMKLPKRYTFFIGTELSHLASEVHNHCKAANSIYPTNEHEAQMRRISRKNVTRQRRKLKNLAGKIPPEDLRISFVSWFGHVSKCKSWKTKTAMKGVFLECMRKSAEKFTPSTT